MINDLEGLLEYFKEHDYPSYTRTNFDRFIKSIGFDFNVKSIHVTGTNGKGSTSNYLRQAYIKNGYKVGFYNSPFFYSPIEMIAIGNENISLDEYLILLNAYAPAFENFSLSSFEIQTFIAYLYFKQNNVDLAIIEVGMGGIIDATNILRNPIACVITSVSLEHCYYLGKTVSEIAQSKAGIITNKCEVIVGKLDEEAMAPISNRVALTKSNLHVIDDFYNEEYQDDSYIFDYGKYKRMEIKTSAFYQIKNATIALEVMDCLNNLFPVKEELIREAFKIRTLICRFEYIDNNTLIDGAHNPEAVENLLETLSRINNRPIHCLFAAFKDKNIDKMLAMLDRDCDDVTITTFEHKRARTEEDYFLYLGDFSFNPDFKDAISKIKEQYPNDLLLICGSLAFVSVVRRYLVK